MIYIKLDTNMQLEMTAREPIYRGDNLCKKIIFVIPKQINEIDMEASTVYLCYIRADGTPDIVTLKRQSESYNENYFQYVVPVTCRLSRFPGEVCAWLQIFSGILSNPITAKSSECLLQIEDSKNMDDYLCDHQISAIYEMQERTDTTESSVESMKIELMNKGDDLSYDEAKKTLQLTSNGKPVGAVVDMSKVGSGDEVIRFESAEVEEPSASADDVIHF